MHHAEGEGPGIRSFYEKKKKKKVGERTEGWWLENVFGVTSFFSDNWQPKFNRAEDVQYWPFHAGSTMTIDLLQYCKTTMSESPILHGVKAN